MSESLCSITYEFGPNECLATLVRRVAEWLTEEPYVLISIHSKFVPMDEGPGFKIICMRQASIEEMDIADYITK